MSSSWADESPGRPPPCCSPVSGMTWWSWTRRRSRATPCPPIRSPAAASSSCAAGGCSTRSWTAVLRPSGRSPSTPPARRSPGRSRTRPGSTFLVAPRRYVLDTLLATAAEHAGAEVRPGVTVTGLQRDGHGRVAGVSGQDRAGARSSSVPARSSAPTASGRGSPGWSTPRSTRPARRAARPSTPTTPASRGPASSSSSPSGPSPACSRPTTGRPASGSARPPPTPRRSAAGPGPAWRRSTSCSSGRTPSWPSGCGRPAGPRRSRACSASPTSSARRSARAGPWSGTPATTVTPSPPTASATPSATPSSWPSPSTRRWPATPRRPRPWRPTSSSATRRSGRSSRSPAAWPPTRRCRAFIELQKQLSAAIDTQAAALAARPVPGERLLATA